jgi:hypothetical protein
VRQRFFLTLTVTVGLLLGLMAAAGPVAAADPMIRVVHGSPDAPPVDVYVDGKKAVSALAFPNATPYTQVPAGKHDLQVFAAGANPASDKPVIDAKGVDIPADAKLSIVASGRLAQIKPLIVDDKTAAPASGKAKVRFVHNSPDAPAVDIAVKGGPVLFANTQFGNAYPYQEVAPGTYDLEVRPTGTQTVALAVPGVSVPAGAVISIYAMGLLNGQGAQKLQAVAFVDSAPAATGGASTGPGMLPTTGKPADHRALNTALLVAVVAAGFVALGLVLRRQAAR